MTTRAWFKTGKSRWHVLLSTNDVGLTACDKLYWNIGRTIELDITEYPVYACRGCLQSLAYTPTRLMPTKKLKSTK